MQAPLQHFEVGDYVRANWAGRGVLYAGEVLATNRENDTVDILYDDGDFESHVPRERVHAVRARPPNPRHTPPDCPPTPPPHLPCSQSQRGPLETQRAPATAAGDD